MKAVFFKSQIPLEVQRLDENGDIIIETIMRSMEQGEVVDLISCDDALMEFIDGTIWWTPDKKLFNLVGIPKMPASCCGGG